MERPFARTLGVPATEHGILMVVTAYALDADKAERLRSRCEREAARQAHHMHVCWGDAAARCPIINAKGAACQKA